MSEVRPTSPAERLWSLDLLRGFALLGILVINVRYFAMPVRSALAGDPFHPSGDWHTPSFWTWFVGDLLFEDKMVGLFSMLFGAGILMQRDRGWRMPVLRMMVLFGFGAAHAFGLWVGDILMVYAVCGLLLLPLRWLPPGWLLGLGILTLLIGVLWREVPALTAPLLPDRVGAELPSLTDPDREQERAAAWSALLGDAEERAHATGDWTELAEWRAELVWLWQFRSAHRFNLWRCGGFMLIGMALLSWRWLDGGRRPRAYAACFGCSLIVALPLVLLSMHADVARLLGATDAFDEGGGALGAATGRLLHHVGAAVLTFSAASLVLWVGQSGWLRKLLQPVRAVGRMALSNYLGHSAACVVMFEGWGLGHFGEWNAWEQFQWVWKLWVASLLVSTGWLLLFRRGPLEWLWRSISYGKLQAMRRPL